MTKKKGWIGVDLDGTLAFSNGQNGVFEVGDPIPAMAERVSKWLCCGQEVRIFTARVGDTQDSLDIYKQEKAIEEWCRKHFGTVLPITCSKDYEMIELWDDRAVQVIKNTGQRADGKDELQSKAAGG
jgi:hypothetical protein